MRGPIKEKVTGRIYAVDDVEDDTTIDIDNVATRAPQDAADAAADAAADDATTDATPTDDSATPASDDETDDQK